MKRRGLIDTVTTKRSSANVSVTPTTTTVMGLVRVPPTAPPVPMVEPRQVHV